MYAVTPTAYYGSKSRLAPLIASLLPPDHLTYVEPFFGSGAVFFTKRPSRTEVINDLDGDVVNFFRVLRDREADLIRACELTPYARKEYEACRDLATDDPVERARRWWVRTNQSFAKQAGTGSGTGWSAGPNRRGADQPHQNVSLIRLMSKAAQRLRPATIECRSAVEVVKKYATRPDVAVYCDPPYLSGARAKSSSDYTLDMPSGDEHQELAEALHAVPAAVLLSGYHSPLYDELYDDWWHLERTVDRPTSNGHGRPMAQVMEVVWSNRPLAGQGSLL